MNKLNKTIVITSYDDLKNPVYAGGGAISVHEVAKRLAGKYKVIVITGTYNNAKDEIIDGVQYFRVGNDIFGHKIGQLIYQIGLLIKLRTLVFDVCVESTTPPFTFSLLPIFNKGFIISWVNMLASYDMQRKYFFNFSIFENILAKRYSNFIVPTKWVYKEVKQMNKKAKIVKISYGCNLSSPKLAVNYKNNKNQFLYIGRVEINQKGLDLLIKAFALTDSKYTLLIAGNGSGKEINALLNLINKYNLNDRIRYIGKVNNKQKAILFKQSLATIIPSRYETFCIVALESISYQRPIICFNIPQIQWIPKKFSFKVKAYEISELAKIINAFTVLYPKQIQKKEIDFFFKQYSWKNFVNQLEKQILR